MGNALITSISPPCYTERRMQTIFDTRKRSGLKRGGRVVACALDH